MGEPETVKLRTGKEEHKALVATIMAIVTDLMKNDPVAVYELVRKARDPNHVIFEGYENKLKDMALLSDDGKFHESVLNVILALVEGDGLDMRLVSPV